MEQSNEYKLKFLETVTIFVEFTNFIEWGIN